MKKILIIIALAFATVELSFLYAEEKAEIIELSNGVEGKIAPPFWRNPSLGGDPEKLVNSDIWIVLSAAGEKESVTETMDRITAAIRQLKNEKIRNSFIDAVNSDKKRNEDFKIEIKKTKIVIKQKISRKNLSVTFTKEGIKIVVPDGLMFVSANKINSTMDTDGEVSVDIMPGRDVRLFCGKIGIYYGDTVVFHPELSTK